MMNSFTEAGDTVHHSPIATAIGDDIPTVNNFNNVKDIGQGHNVIVHGSGPLGEKGGRVILYDEVGGVSIVNDKPTNMIQVAEAVRSNPDYVAGTPICLGSCWSGSSGTAQELAELMHAPVLAPTRPVAWDSKTNTWILDVEDKKRAAAPLDYQEIKPEWKMFYPKR